MYIGISQKNFIKRWLLVMTFRALCVLLVAILLALGVLVVIFFFGAHPSNSDTSNANSSGGTSSLQSIASSMANMTDSADSASDKSSKDKSSKEKSEEEKSEKEKSSEEKSKEEKSSKEKSKEEKSSEEKSKEEKSSEEKSKEEKSEEISELISEMIDSKMAEQLSSEGSTAQSSDELTKELTELVMEMIDSEAAEQIAASSGIPGQSTVIIAGVILNLDDVTLIPQEGSYSIPCVDNPYEAGFYAVCCPKGRDITVELPEKTTAISVAVSFRDSDNNLSELSEFEELDLTQGENGLEVQYSIPDHPEKGYTTDCPLFYGIFRIDTTEGCEYFAISY